MVPFFAMTKQKEDELAPPSLMLIMSDRVVISIGVAWVVDVPIPSDPVSPQPKPNIFPSEFKTIVVVHPGAI